MTFYILVITIAVSVLALQSGKLMSRLVLNPYRVQNFKEWYRFFTCGFIHADWVHLLINALVFYSFGGMVELFFNLTFGTLGTYYFLMLYAGSLVVSALPSYFKHRHDFYYNSLGASGAVSAIVFSFIIFRPMDTISLYFIIKLPAIIVGVGYLVYEYYMGKKGNDHINHDAHFWGALYGVAYTVLLKPSLAVDFIGQITSFGR